MANKNKKNLVIYADEIDNIMKIKIKNNTEIKIENNIENTTKFVTAIFEDICLNNSYHICCLCKDIFLKDYNYNPQLNKCGQIIHLWEHTRFRDVLTICDIRYVLGNYLFSQMQELEYEYLAKSQNYEPNDDEHEKIQRNIKHFAQYAVLFSSGVVYKEFIDCYNKGYFN